MKRSLFLLATLAIPSLLSAQGILPPTTSSTTTTAVDPGPLFINQHVSPNLLVTEESAKTRTLLSYKAPVEVLLVGFFSADCAENQNQWVGLRRLYDRFKEWRVSFVVVNEGASLSKLKEDLRTARINPEAIVNDPDRSVARYFSIRETPTLLVLDESGDLRYRGPLEGYSLDDKKPVAYTRRALEAVIGHISAVPATEPRAAASCPLPQP